MTCLKKTACLLLAVSICFAAGCSDNDTDNSKDNSSKADSAASTAAESSADSEPEKDKSTSAQEDDSSAEETEYTLGENLAKTLELFSGSYTYTAKVTYSDEEGVTEVVQASDGESFYQRSIESGSGALDGDTAYLYTDSKGYDIDFNLKAFNECEQKSGLNLFEQIKENKLEQTDTHIPKDTEDMTVEEYTYAGDTYMTVFDFYFGEDGALNKYTATYSVEGEDDIIQTVEIVSITQDADEAYFDTAALDELTDFGEISEDTRLGFCQGICATYEISTDQMYEMDITTDDLKRIDFDTFRELVYTYASVE